MNFLFVGTNPEPTGAATHFAALAQALADAGHDVGAVVHPDGLIWHQLEATRVCRYPATFCNAFDLSACATVWRAARARRADWIVGNFGKEYWPLAVLGRLLGIPVALFRHRAPRMRAVSAFCIPRLARRFFAVSANARQAYLDQGIPPHLVRVLYNPVDMQACRPDPRTSHRLRASLGIDDDAVVLGYVGRLQTGKGIGMLLDAATSAMASQPRLHCVWIGDGPQAAALRGRAGHGAYAARHHFVRWLDDARPWYSALSMLALPSIAPETFGRVSVEAQAAGVPVLASNIGGVPETLQPGVTGLLLPPGDTSAWRDAILRLCAPEARAPLAAAARGFVEAHFSGAVIAADFVRQLAEG